MWAPNQLKCHTPRRRILIQCSSQACSIGFMSGQTWHRKEVCFKDFETKPFGGVLFGWLNCTAYKFSLWSQHKWGKNLWMCRFLQSHVIPCCEYFFSQTLQRYINPLLQNPTPVWKELTRDNVSLKYSSKVLCIIFSSSAEVRRVGWEEEAKQKGRGRGNVMDLTVGSLFHFVIISSRNEISPLLSCKIGGIAVLDYELGLPGSNLTCGSCVCFVLFCFPKVWKVMTVASFEPRENGHSFSRECILQ